MLSSLALRLKALSPFHIVVLAIVALAVLGSSTAVASKLITGADVKDRSLTGRDIARGSVSHSNLKDDSVTSRDIKDGTVHSIDLSPGVRAQLAKSGAGGVVGKDGAKGENGDTGPQGAKGDAGAQGPKGDVGAAGGGAAGGFVIKDADGTTAGPMLTPASQFTSQKGSFYYTGHIFDVDFRSGDLQFATMGFYYTTADCTGTPYTTVNYAQSVVKSANPSDAGNLYEFGEIGTVDVKSSMGSGFGPATCTTWPAGNGDNFSGLARMNVLSAGDTPPGLHGPMRIVPAS